MCAQKTKEEVSLDASRKAEDAIQLLSGFGPDIYKDHEQISKILQDLMSYLENGK